MSTPLSPPSYSGIARMIDHALLQPFMTDEEVRAGCGLARHYGVAAACVKPRSTAFVRDLLAGSGTAVCAVIGFPHGNSTTPIKVAEARQVTSDGATEVDMVIHAGSVLGGAWEEVAEDISAVNAVCTDAGAILKVIFETDYLQDNPIVRLCGICSEIGVAFVKTSTGYGFVKRAGGGFDYEGATVARVRLMRGHCAPSVEIKAAGGIRTLDDVLAMRGAGATRIGASATAAILDETMARFGGGPGPIAGVKAQAGY